MAKYSSIYEVKGHIGASTFQIRKGRFIVGRTSSLDKEKVMTAEEFARTRENMREFGGSASAGKALRLGLAASVERFADGRLAGRLTGKFRKMVNAGSGMRGERGIEVFANRVQLVNMEFDKEMPLSQAFFADHFVTVNTTRNEVTLDVPAFVLRSFLRIPQGATHWNLVLTAAVMTDHVYDPTTTQYVAMDPTLNGLRAGVETGPMSLNGAMLAPIQLIATIPGNPTMTNNAVLVACVGVEFSQDVNGLPYVFAQHNAMRIVNAF